MNIASNNTTHLADSKSTIEKSLVILKPDTVERGLVGEITLRFERAGLRLAGMKLVQADAKMASDHYGDLVERYSEKLGHDRAVAIKKGMVDFLSSGVVVVMALEGVGACAVVRKMVGGTYPHEAVPGTIRGDYAHVSQAFANDGGFPVKNLVHASGNVEEAEAELKIWFNDNELFDYEPVHFKHTRR